MELGHILHCLHVHVAASFSRFNTYGFFHVGHGERYPTTPEDMRQRFTQAFRSINESNQTATVQDSFE
jgi:hypothetical protein